MSTIESLMNEIGSRLSFYIGRKKLIFGNTENPNEILESISIVLSQALDSLKEVPIRDITIQGDDEYILITIKGKEIFGFVLKNDIDKDDVLRIYHSKEEEIFEELFPKKKPEVKVEEVKKIEKPVKEEKKIEEIEEKGKEEKEEKIILSPDVLDKVREIATETLGDFAAEIFDNIVKDIGIVKENINKDKLMELVNELEKSAKMIVGPTKAGNMKDDILKHLKEV